MNIPVAEVRPGPGGSQGDDRRAAVRDRVLGVDALEDDDARGDPDGERHERGEAAHREAWDRGLLRERERRRGRRPDPACGDDRTVADLGEPRAVGAADARAHAARLARVERDA
jgi:hypothetical protein